MKDPSSPLRIANFALDQGPTSATLLFIRGSARFAEGDAQPPREGGDAVGMRHPGRSS